MRDPLSCTFWPTDFFFIFFLFLTGLVFTGFFFFFSFLLHWVWSSSLGSVFFIGFFFFTGFEFLGTRKEKKKKSCTVTGVGPLNSVKNSEWWKLSDGTKQPWYFEWWVMSDGNLVIKKSEPKQALTFELCDYFKEGGDICAKGTSHI